MFSDRSTATSRRRLGKFSSVTMAPSMLMTKTLSRKRGMYWRMPRRSVNFTSVVFGYLAGIAPEAVCTYDKGAQPTSVQLQRSDATHLDSTRQGHTFLGPKRA